MSDIIIATPFSAIRTTAKTAHAADSPTWCLRGTFIDEVSEEQLFQSARWRSRSAPASPVASVGRCSSGSADAAGVVASAGSIAEGDTFAEERSYVSHLTERIRAGHFALQLDAEGSKGMLNPSRSWRKTLESKSVGNISAAETGDFEVAATELEQSSDIRFSSFSEISSAGGSAAGADSDMSLKDSFTNIGSVGHPYLCSRPCLYFMSGQCANGDNCDYCHLPHSKRPVHLEKKHRDVLRDMPTSRALELALPIMREKVIFFDDSEESLAALGRFASACGVSERVLLRSNSRPPRLPRSERSLVPALRGMSLRLLLFTLQKGILSENDTEAQEAATALLAQLRRNATTINTSSAAEFTSTCD